MNVLACCFLTQLTSQQPWGGEPSVDRMWLGDNGRPQVPPRERKVPVEPREDSGG